MAGESITGAPPSEVPASTGTAPWLPGPNPRRAQAAAILLALNIAMSVATVVAVLGHIRLLEALQRVCGIGLVRPCTFEEGSGILRAAEASDRRLFTFGIAGTALVVVTGIVWLVWQYRARKEVDRRGPVSFRYSAGWGVGSWFVPIVNLWVPLLAVRRSGARRTPSPGPSIGAKILPGRHGRESAP
jgi:heme/copper-type cytochrome/quinol oxidase subunit 2